jgi:hypothetical protein
MADDSVSRTIGNGGTMSLKIPGTVLLITFVLSLATWFFFYMVSMPLKSAETIATVVLWALVVGGLFALRKRKQKRIRAGSHGHE